MPSLVRYNPYPSKYGSLIASAANLGRGLHRAKKLGEVVGRGAKRVYKTYKSFNKSKPRKKQKTGHSEIPKKSGYKSKCAGKNVKLGGKQKKLPKVTKAFKAKVASALVPKSITSTYNATWHAKLEAVPNGSAELNFQKASNAATDGAGTALVAGTGAPLFDIFHPDRVLDQASILFNAKPGSTSQDWVTDAGGDNFAKKGLEITVVSQSFRVTCHNCTLQSKEILWYECTPKENTDVSAIACFDQCLAEDWDDGNMISSSEVFSTMYGITPGATLNFKDAFAYNVRKMVLAPGQSSKFSLNGPANHTYKYDTYKEMEGTADITYPKKLGVQLFYVIRNTENLQSGYISGSNKYINSRNSY